MSSDWTMSDDDILTSDLDDDLLPASDDADGDDESDGDDADSDDSDSDDADS